MTTHNQSSTQDPFGLSGLPLLESDTDGWPAIRAALEADAAVRQRRRWQLAGLAAAASVLLVVGMAWQTGNAPLSGEPVQVAQTSPDTQQPVVNPVEPTTLPDLIATSQLLETRLRQLRDSTSGMAGRSAVWSTELEDMIARVDGEISQDPESLNLWAQRVNLLLDLQYIYQHQFDREFGRMASL
jgi:hypothetical protein